MLDWGSLPAVRATLNFIAGEVSGISQFHKAPESPPDHLPHEAREVLLHDMCPVMSELRLDREGFVVVDFDDGQPDFDDRQQLETIWLPRMQQMLKRETGADHVFSWAFGRRFSPKLPQSRQTQVTTAAVMVHTDFSPGPIGLTIDNKTVDEVIAEVVGDDRPRHWLALNVWQPTTPPPHDRPVALCDLASLRAEDICIAQGSSTYENGMTVRHELTWAKYGAHQRWAYFRDLQPDQAILFSGLDMSAAPTFGLVEHASFELPDLPPGSRPRESVEARNLLIWD